MTSNLLNNRSIIICAKGTHRFLFIYCLSVLLTSGLPGVAWLLPAAACACLSLHHNPDNFNWRPFLLEMQVRKQAGRRQAVQWAIERSRFDVLVKLGLHR